MVLEGWNLYIFLNTVCAILRCSLSSAAIKNKHTIRYENRFVCVSSF